LLDQMLAILPEEPQAGEMLLGRALRDDMPIRLLCSSIADDSGPGEFEAQPWILRP